MTKAEHHICAKFFVQRCNARCVRPDDVPTGLSRGARRRSPGNRDSRLSRRVPGHERQGRPRHHRRPPGSEVRGRNGRLLRGRTAQTHRRGHPGPGVPSDRGLHRLTSVITEPSRGSRDPADLSRRGPSASGCRLRSRPATVRSPCGQYAPATPPVTAKWPGSSIARNTSRPLTDGRRSATRRRRVTPSAQSCLASATRPCFTIVTFVLTGVIPLEARQTRLGGPNACG